MAAGLVRFSGKYMGDFAANSQAGVSTRAAPSKIAMFNGWVWVIFLSCLSLL
jgi:hypothetical protein